MPQSSLVHTGQIPSPDIPAIRPPLRASQRRAPDV